MSIKHLVSQYEPRTKTVELNDNLKVVYVESSYQKTVDKVKELLCLLKGALLIKPLTGNKKSSIPFEFDIDFAAIAANMKSDEAKALEDFVKNNCRIALKHEGEWLNVEVDQKDQFEYVFNAFPEKLLPYLVEGVKFHFLKYFPSILDTLLSSAKDQANQEVNKTLLTQLQTGSKEEKS